MRSVTRLLMRPVSPILNATTRAARLRTSPPFPRRSYQKVYFPPEPPQSRWSRFTSFPRRRPFAILLAGLLLYLPVRVLYQYLLLGSDFEYQEAVRKNKQLYPARVAEELRKALYFSSISPDIRAAIHHFRKAIECADQEKMNPFSDEVMGIKIQCAAAMEAAGLGGQAYELLAILMNDLLKQERSLVAKAKAIQEKSGRASSSQPPGEHSDGGAAAKELESEARAKAALKIEAVQADIFRASRTLVRLETKLALLAAEHDVSPSRLTTVGLFLEDAIRRALLEHEHRKTEPTEATRDGAWLTADELGALLHIVGEFYGLINRPAVMIALFRRCLQFVPHNSDFEMEILTDLGRAILTNDEGSARNEARREEEIRNGTVIGGLFDGEKYDYAATVRGDWLERIARNDQWKPLPGAEEADDAVEDQSQDALAVGPYRTPDTELDAAGSLSTPPQPSDSSSSDPPPPPAARTAYSRTSPYNADPATAAHYALEYLLRACDLAHAFLADLPPDPAPFSQLQATADPQAEPRAGSLPPAPALPAISEPNGPNDPTTTSEADAPGIEAPWYAHISCPSSALALALNQRLSRLMKRHNADLEQLALEIHDAEAAKHSTAPTVVAAAAAEQLKRWSPFSRTDKDDGSNDNPSAPPASAPPSLLTPVPVYQPPLPSTEEQKQAQHQIKLLMYALHLEGFLGLSYLLTGDAHAAHAAFANLVQTARRFGVEPLPVPTPVQVQAPGGDDGTSDESDALTIRTKNSTDQSERLSAAGQQLLVLLGAGAVVLQPLRPRMNPKLHEEIDRRIGPGPRRPRRVQGQPGELLAVALREMRRLEGVVGGRVLQDAEEEEGRRTRTRIS